MYQLIIVDDEKTIVDGMGKLFPWEQIGFQVAGLFTSAKEALDFLDRHSVDVVMSDIEMPDMDGIEFSRRLIERKNLEVILFSSHKRYDYFRAAIQNKVADFLLKPIDYAMLLESIGKVKDELDSKNQRKVEIPEGYYDRIIASVQDYLMTNYQDASLEKAAEKVNLSPAYLSKIFKTKSGSSFTDTLLKIRMEMACSMLKNPDCRAYDVAWYIGYDNPKSFSRAFKNYFGLSPMEYKKEHFGEEQG